MTGAIAVSRGQALAYRVAAQGLHRDGTTVSGLAVLDIGVQEAMGQPAALAFAARLPETAPLGPGKTAIGPGHRLALAWSLRGAPHVHRRRDLDALTGALWPLSEPDAAGRLNESGPSIRRSGISALDQFAAARDTMREVVRAPMSKGDASAEVSKRLPKPMLRECRACKTSHISDSAMRAAFLAAGLEMAPGTSPPVLRPRAGAAAPAEADLAALTELALRYLALLGPATVGEFAGYLEARRADVARAWPDDLAQVSVDGRTAFLPAGRLAALRDAPAPELVRLLGPFDPYLQARDRDLIVPDKTVHKTLWPVLGRPGAVFVDGEVVGVWRTKSSGPKLTVTVEAFAPLAPSTWSLLENEAQRVAEVRGATDVAVRRKD
ncbi:DNA glycosylase AlkZ-like family protein [uncultured Jatrophihabitans sp.]|uniref:DNA glycosylase AlkZ-like family protein n=1 Tax=uncultured Jatrophihabitans sp. TaxID=1610747 RepID=UPI0035CC4D4B